MVPHPLEPAHSHVSQSVCERGGRKGGEGGRNGRGDMKSTKSLSSFCASVNHAVKDGVYSTFD